MRYLCLDCSAVSEDKECSCGSELEGEPVGPAAADLISELTYELQRRDALGATIPNVDNLESMLEAGIEFEPFEGIVIRKEPDTYGWQISWSEEPGLTEKEFRIQQYRQGQQDRVASKVPATLTEWYLRGYSDSSHSAIPDDLTESRTAHLEGPFQRLDDAFERSDEIAAELSGLDNPDKHN